VRWLGNGGEVVAAMELSGRALDLRRQEESGDGCGVLQLGSRPFIGAGEGWEVAVEGGAAAVI
jgi:hypothetical protein